MDAQCDALRSKLEAEQSERGGGSNAKKGLKSHQVHELAKAKIEESEKLRRALGIRKDYEEGGHWKRQEERKGKEESGKRDDVGKSRDEGREERRYRDRD